MFIFHWPLLGCSALETVEGKMVPVYGNSRLNPLMWKLVGVTFLVSTEMKEGFGPVQINVATWSSMSRLMMSWQNIYFP